MEKVSDKSNKNKNVLSNGLAKHLEMQWPENLTVLDLSNRKIVEFNENIVLPPNLTDLNLSHNNFKNIPNALLNLSNIKKLNLSYNSLMYFDDTPNFCHSIESLNLSNNSLAGPPYWVWSESPSQLVHINLSSNVNLTHSLENSYLKELVQYKSLVTEVIIFNCRIRKHLLLLAAFPKVKTFEIGKPDYSTILSNHLQHIPCTGLDQCCDIERLNLSNTQICNIEPNIDMYKKLIEINLTQNNLSGLPNTFCNLENLEVCVLSANKILYLPEDMVKLKKLVCLRLDDNQLCMLPDDLCSLPRLKILDLYDNSLYEVPNEVKNMEELDFAQNYLDELEDEEYLEKRRRLRLNTDHRSNGRKIINQSDSEHSIDTTDDEELLEYLNQRKNDPPAQDVNSESSTEDWDSDEYWVPHFRYHNAPSQAGWIHFVKNKMQEGNFCPMDLHTISVEEKVRYEKMCNPKPLTIVQGQFDDYSEEES